MYMINFLVDALFFLLHTAHIVNVPISYQHINKESVTKCLGSSVPLKINSFWASKDCRVIPSEAVTEPCGHRLQFASWCNILLISNITKLGKSGSVHAWTSTKLECLKWNDSIHKTSDLVRLNILLIGNGLH